MSSVSGTMDKTARYRLVITGELRPGHQPEAAAAALAEIFAAPAAQLRRLFDGARHPIDHAFPFDQAQQLQQRLEQLGVDTQMEKIASAHVPLTLRTPPAGSASAPSARPSTPSHHAGEHWREAWADAHVEYEPDEQERLGIFIGPKAPGYLRRFERVRENDRPAFGLSWNWGAVASPFLWALYRRVWGWALVIGMMEVILPLLAFTLSQHGMLPPRFAVMAYLSVIGNRLFWPAVADYIYYRHAHSTLLYLFHMMPGVASEAEIANAGRVSRSAVFLGIALSVVLVVFLWTLIGSLRPVGTAPSELPPPEVLLRQQEAAPAAGSQGIVEISREDEIRWGSTRRKMGELDWAIRAWLARQDDQDAAATLSLGRVQDEQALAPDAVRDGWANEIRYLADRKGYRLVSAGPDQLFGTEDDIVFRRILQKQPAP